MKLVSIVLVFLVVAISADSPGIRVDLSNAFLNKVTFPLYRIVLTQYLAALAFPLQDINATTSNYNATFTDITFNNTQIRAIPNISLGQNNVSIDFSTLSGIVWWTFTWSMGDKHGSIKNSTKFSFDATLLAVIKSNEGKPEIYIPSISMSKVEIENKTYSLPDVLQTIPYDTLMNVIHNHSNYISTAIATTLQSKIDSLWRGGIYPLPIPQFPTPITVDYRLTGDPVSTPQYLTVGVKGKVAVGNASCPEFILPPHNQTYDFQLLVSRSIILCALPQILGAVPTLFDSRVNVDIALREDVSNVIQFVKDASKSFAAKIDVPLKFAVKPSQSAEPFITLYPNVTAKVKLDILLPQDNILANASAQVDTCTLSCDFNAISPQVPDRYRSQITPSSFAVIAQKIISLGSISKVLNLQEYATILEFLLDITNTLAIETSQDWLMLRVNILNQ